MSRLRARLVEENFDAVLVFAQESHYWLTGYDTGGFVYFQTMLVTAAPSEPILLTRRPDLLQARVTSTIKDIRIWWDSESANPAETLRDILREKGLAGKRIAVEMSTHGLTGWNLLRLQRALDGFCTIEFDRHLVRFLRLIKSPEEIDVMRKAGRILDRSLNAVIESAGPGVMDSALAAQYLSVVLGSGGDMPPNAPLFNSGSRAVYGRGVTQPRALAEIDQILVEYPVSYRRYNVKTEWTIVLGTATDTQKRMYDTVRGTLARMTEISRPGVTLGELFDAHAQGLDNAGYRAHRFGATGYSVGISYAPTSMDVPPMIYSGNPMICEPGMTLFYHVMLGDSDTGYAMGVGHTLAIRDGAPEVLTGLPPTLTVIS
ncbi:Xaa-Pro peptidase family protein [Acetobacter sp. TBRC 12305]|uniref:Aminopeptidase P family protein n=1 Tax=Acetobacter garciniae TaxID=2817435 RepID=A0A939KR16_9PROT|nr:Xaa-Pro peptidase family protein [Acetobacter garciniae]MBO1324446.1 aminopeptidase P family protein [Acetobacter garciniae]MBX0344135.1 Xaa-Pro peptidase family protein [Acetobacter garciniae]